MRGWLQLEFKWPWSRGVPAAVREPATEPAAGPPASPAREEARVDVAMLERWCRDQARRLRLRKLAAAVEVRWNGRLQSTAGRAQWPECWIELNPRLNELGEDEVWRTLKHELAHLVAFSRARGRRIAPHGPEWRRACTELGIPGESATHALPLKTRRMKRRFAYACGNCGERILRVRRMRGHVACYACCRRFNRGRFDARFRLVEVPLGDPRGSEG